MSTPSPHQPPEGLSAFETLLHHYATHPNTHLPNPLDTLDTESVHHTATHGPRTPDEATHILNTPHLLAMLTELWEEDPPTTQLTTHLRTTPEGRDLLIHTNRPQGKGGLEDIRDPLTPAALEGFHRDIVLFLTEERPSLLQLRSGGSGGTDRATVTTWVYESRAIPGLKLHVSQHTNPDTRLPELHVTLRDPSHLTRTGQTTWQLTLTTTVDETGHFDTHTTEPTNLPEHSYTWALATHHTPPMIRITLTPIT
jgi:hypothetical protein